MASIGVHLVCFMFAVIYSSYTVDGIQDYCSLNTFGTNETFMQLTKEPSVEEFAIAKKFKGLHCCAKGYRSIEWYKDGKLYPWPIKVSQLILYPESANQTVYAQAVTEADAGNYTCIVRNDSIMISHTILLKVFEKVPDDPHITYISPDHQVLRGQDVRLFCEAFAGRVDLPDAMNEVVWQKIGHNDTVDDEPRVRQQKTSRENGQTFGTYLIIKDVKKSDYGTYVCRISKPGKTIEQYVLVTEQIQVEFLDPNPIPIGKLLLCMSAILFLFMVVVILNMQYSLPLRLRFKDSFGRVEDNDGKLSDALILYSQKDSELALGVLVPTLESRYSYKCISKELPYNMTSWCAYLTNDISKTRRVIVLLSPSILGDDWDAATIYQAIKLLGNFTTKIVFVTLKELPISSSDLKNSQGETLNSLVKLLNIIHWERSHDDKFWLALRLRLPPKRGSEIKILENRNSIQSNNASRLNSNSEESLHDFV